MDSQRIQMIQRGSAYPKSHSVSAALFQVWNECSREHQADVKKLMRRIEELETINLEWQESHIALLP